ncbi:MAG TPA: LysR family transcriptional regulator [Alphaproteobacteria bacterium]|nr:LysR family transcriptional regulator [Alphaproteobacteria bacterium]
MNFEERYVLDWNKLKIFYYVAKHKNISSAAREINISQSSLSRHVIHLEQRLKLQLFERKSTGLLLTKQGEVLYQTVKKIMEELDAAQHFLREASSEIQGTLKVETTNSLVNSWLVYYLGEFNTRFPEINLRIIGDDHLSDPDKNPIEVSLRPYVHTHNEDLIQDYLMKWHLKLYAHPSYLANFGVPQDISELENHRLLSFGGGQDVAKPYDEVNWLLRLSEKSLEPYMCINSSYGLFSAAEAGLGIVSLSQESPLLRASKLIPILPHITGPQIEIYYIYPKALSHFKRINVFREFLKEIIIRDHKPSQ